MYNSNINGNAVFYVTRGESGQTFEGNVAVRSLCWDEKGFDKISKLLAHSTEASFSVEEFAPGGEDNDVHYLVMSDSLASRPFPAIIIVKYLEAGDDEIMVDVDAKEDKSFIEYAIKRYLLDVPFDVVNLTIDLDADLDEEDACFLTEIGNACIKGSFVRRDLQTARRFFEAAASAGDADAMVELGDMYLDGIGVYQYVPIAEEYYKIAAMNGSVMALINLGTLYARDEYGMLDSEKSIKCFRAAAEKAKQNKPENCDMPAGSPKTDHATESVPEKTEENGERSGV